MSIGYNFNMPVILFDIDYTLFDTKLFKESNLTEYRIYDEVESTLTMLKKQAKLGIFSEGRQDFQKAKLQNTGIFSLFDSNLIFIVPDKFEALREIVSTFENKKNIFLVDDKLSILAEVKAVLPEMTTIWVKRGFYAEHARPIAGFTPDLSIETIQDLPQIFSQ